MAVIPHKVIRIMKKIVPLSAILQILSEILLNRFNSTLPTKHQMSTLIFTDL